VPLYVLAGRCLVQGLSPRTADETRHSAIISDGAQRQPIQAWPFQNARSAPRRLRSR
jgi:hypothetical protein